MGAQSQRGVTCRTSATQGPLLSTQSISDVTKRRPQACDVGKARKENCGCTLVGTAWISGGGEGLKTTGRKISAGSVPHQTEPNVCEVRSV